MATVASGGLICQKVSEEHAHKRRRDLDCTRGTYRPDRMWDKRYHCSLRRVRNDFPTDFPTRVLLTSGISTATTPKRPWIRRPRLRKPVTQSVGETGEAYCTTKGVTGLYTRTARGVLAGTAVRIIA